MAVDTHHPHYLPLQGERFAKQEEAPQVPTADSDRHQDLDPVPGILGDR